MGLPAADHAFRHRLLDLTLALILLLPVALALAAIAVAVLLCDGRPLFYGSERMRSPDRGFTLWKIRTMRADPADIGVSGGYKDARVTMTGRWLRRYRLDELPQLWNVLRGDIGLVGPRPPLRAYVERFPLLYAQVLRVRPGITGLATVAIHRHEARLLTGAASPEETDAIYARRCVPRKARLDLIHQRHRSLRFDLAILWATLYRVMPGRGALPRQVLHRPSGPGRS